ncbi:MAG TPA: tetratricopeptide repeat protein [Gallionellaceae bacterium]|nr:tetratricopeptide repeat protein [Gallionellaceae bacterium]
MRNRFALYFISAWLLLLAGCAGVKAPPSAAPAAPGAEAPLAGESAAPVPPQAVPPEPVQSSAMSGNRAVIALLDRAQRDNAAGQREAAGASLERALRIEPRNPWLWLELAQLRLAQGQYAQAITLARKSNSFARKQRRVQAENWQVIGQARAAQGDSAGAEKAFKLSAELLQQDKDESGFGIFR